MELDISWPGGQAKFKPNDSPVKIGRSSESNVQVTYASASRNHLELSWDGANWKVSDLSAHGSYRDGSRLPKSWTLESSADVSLGGPEGDTVALQFAAPIETVPAESNSSPFAEPAKPGLVTSADIQEETNKTSVFDAQLPPPGSSESNAAASAPLGAVAAGSAANPAALNEALPGAWNGQPSNGPTASPSVLESTNQHSSSATQAPSAAPQQATTQPIMISIDGQERTFTTPEDITVGRDPGCTVPVEERHALVSRSHLKISHRQGAWWIEDTSSRGSYVDGARIVKPYQAAGKFTISLGDQSAGIPLKIMTAGEHRAKKQFNYAAAAAVAAAVLLPVAILLFILNSGGSSEETDLVTARQSTAMLLNEAGWGTGFFVADDLILTNLHLANQSEEHLVAVSRTDGEPVKIEYTAEVAAKHNFLDVALLKVTKTVETDTTDAQAVDSSKIGIKPISMGGENDVNAGEEFDIAGFPAEFSPSSNDDPTEIELVPAVTDSGSAGKSKRWPSCNNSEWQEQITVDEGSGVTCSPLSSIDRALLVSEFEGEPKSVGSPVVLNNQVVGILFSTTEDENLVISSSAFKSWLDERIQAEK